MMNVMLTTAIDTPWVNLDPVRIGEVPRTLGTPSRYVLVSSSETPVLRLDLYGPNDECAVFEEALLWEKHVVIGFGERLYFVELESLEFRDIKLEGYFGSTWQTPGRLFAASLEHVFCFDGSAELMWKSPQLGIDGVVIHDVANEVVHGSGEWDPPGGWKDFRISANDGKFLP